MSKNNQARGYGGYQGRRSSGVKSVLKGIIIFLLILLIAAVAALYFLQDNLIYSDDGVKLEVPWESGETSSAGPEVSSPILIMDNTDEEKPSEEPASQNLHAVYVSRTALLAGTAAEQVATSGGNAAVFTMKNDDGTLNYVSAVPTAIAAGVSGSDPAVNAAIKEINNGELYTVALLSCFRDHALPSYDSELAIHTNSGYRWVDYEEIRWTSPASETVRNYLTDLCVELAEMGFDEILLTNCGYPPTESGNMGWIRKGEAYPKGALDSVVILFLEQVNAALEPYDVKLSVYTESKYLEGSMGADTDTGLTPALLLGNCDRIWLPGEQAALGLTYSSVSDRTAAEERLVLCGSEAGNEDEDWAIF